MVKNSFFIKNWICYINIILLFSKTRECRRLTIPVNLCTRFRAVRCVVCALSSGSAVSFWMLYLRGPASHVGAPARVLCRISKNNPCTSPHPHPSTSPLTPTCWRSGWSSLCSLMYCPVHPMCCVVLCLIFFIIFMIVGYLI